MSSDSFLNIKSFKGAISDIDALDRDLKALVDWDDSFLDEINDYGNRKVRSIWTGRLVDLQNGKLVLFDAFGEDRSGEYGDRLFTWLMPKNYLQIFAKYLSEGEIKFRYDDECNEEPEFYVVTPGKVREIDPWK